MNVFEAGNDLYIKKTFFSEILLETKGGGGCSPKGQVNSAHEKCVAGEE